MFSADDTIVAIATPPGRGGIGVVRLSGPDAGRISRALIRRRAPLANRHATFARVVDPAAALSADTSGAIDQVVVTAFDAPHSYTGDDVVEISGHGSPVLLESIVRLAVAAGARLAEPGEFTLRAHLNGRIDLAQAEAVADLVESVTPLQARAAMDQLEGTLTSAIARLDEALLDLTAKLEASLDFPEEGFHFVTPEQVVAEVGRLEAALGALAASGRRGRVIREGALVVITGPPNAGKSSLFNALAGAARAIVTEVPGTTRDVLTERVDVEGVPVTLVDTAGLREAADAIEAEGVARARQAQKVAALTMVVLDGSRPLGEAERAVLAGAAAPRIVVLNKADLVRRVTATDVAGEAGGEQTGTRGVPVVRVSAVMGEGLDGLRALVVAALGAIPEHDARDTPAISNVRHLALVERALDALGRAREAVEGGATEELVLVELSAARQALEELTGRRTTDDLLQHIFARFCVGK
jgi:tRNA modification GTPase